MADAADPAADQAGAGGGGGGEDAVIPKRDAHDPEYQPKQAYTARSKLDWKDPWLWNDIISCLTDDSGFLLPNATSRSLHPTATQAPSGRT